MPALLDSIELGRPNWTYIQRKVRSLLSCLIFDKDCCPELPMTRDVEVSCTSQLNGSKGSRLLDEHVPVLKLITLDVKCYISHATSSHANSNLMVSMLSSEKGVRANANPQ